MRIALNKNTRRWRVGIDVIGLSQAFGATACGCRSLPIRVLVGRIAQIAPWLPSVATLVRAGAGAFRIATQ